MLDRKREDGEFEARLRPYIQHLQSDMDANNDEHEFRHLLLFHFPAGLFPMQILRCMRTGSGRRVIIIFLLGWIGFTLLFLTCLFYSRLDIIASVNFLSKYRSAHWDLDFLFGIVGFGSAEEANEGEGNLCILDRRVVRT